MVSKRFFSVFPAVIIILLNSLEISEGGESYCMELETKLQFGDKCSWKLEKERQVAAEKMVGLGDDFTFNPINVIWITIELNSKWEELVEIVQKRKDDYCNFGRLLVCDEETERCRCGEFWKGELSDRNNFVEEFENGSKICRWKPQSPCFPVNYKGAVDFEHKCAQDTDCKWVGDGSHCSFMSSAHYFLTYGVESMRKFIMEMGTKFCSCETTLGDPTPSPGESQISVDFLPWPIKEIFQAISTLFQTDAGHCAFTI